MGTEMSAEYRNISNHIRKILKESTLSETEKYSLLSATITEVANQYHSLDFQQIKLRLALICQSMLFAAEAAEKIFGTLKKTR